MDKKIVTRVQTALTDPSRHANVVFHCVSGVTRSPVSLVLRISLRVRIGNHFAIFLGRRFSHHDLSETYMNIVETLSSNQGLVKHVL